jgi:fumarate hydratase subunit beta
MIEALDRGEELPIPLEREVLYYVGPTPPRPGQAIGAAGPTTAYRMDPYTPALVAHGLGGMIGKGWRGPEVRECLVGSACVYMATFGGAGALLSKRITAAEVVAWYDLGTEAVRRLTVEEFPVIVINDTIGADYYQVAQAPWSARRGA